MSDSFNWVTQFGEAVIKRAFLTQSVQRANTI